MNKYTRVSILDHFNIRLEFNFKWEREKISLPPKDNPFEVKKNTDNKIFGYMQN